ncbi:hypothetical protein [Natrarchaeobaculum aegyptiacum]|uniref:Uncharacterized protein n=1 Tax=Natrarchaeobaculum aegyptiacum TaxID=745377 RepID=A0A2Z2HPF6_9EURY|nr:hypothetical protein [Natrarchaeobaculum aegyptiacum]ARS88802.1 hypothetical protein B1756_02860 [Natrarchaeobaculum aegyptiacum]
MTDEARGLRGALERVRTDRTSHAAAFAVVVLVGVALAWIHWLGLVLAGALVGLVSPSLWRAIAGGFVVGLVVLIAFALTLGGALGPTLEMTPIVWLAVASALGLPVLGSLIRGIE